MHFNLLDKDLLLSYFPIRLTYFNGDLFVLTQDTLVQTKTPEQAS